MIDWDELFKEYVLEDKIIKLKTDEEELKELINSYNRWWPNLEKERWKTSLLSEINRMYDIDACPRCGENAVTNIIIKYYDDGFSIYLYIYCPECRKIEVKKQINDYYIDGESVENVVNEFNSLKERF